MNPRLLRLFAVLAIPVILFTITSSFIFEWMWLDQMGYSQVFWTVRTTQVLLTVIAFAVAGLFLVWNLRFLAGQLQNINFAGTPLQNLNIDLAFSRRQKQMKQFATFIGLGVALLFAVGFYISWDESLRFVWSVPYGEEDPLFGKDVGFYLFQLPFWQLIQRSLTVLTLFTLVIMAFIYVITGLIGSRTGGGFRASQSVQNHLKRNGALLAALLAWGFYLARYNLLLGQDGLIVGAGYTDVTFDLPALWLLTGLTALLSILLLAGNRIRSSKAVPTVIALTVLVLAVGRVILPQLVQNFHVEPYELELETPYLEHNITMTRMAFGLDKIQDIDYQADDTLTIDDIRNNQDAIDNIRLWDPRLLIQTYRQLQEIRSYYEFYNVDNDRYTIDGDVVQTMLSAREIARTLPSQSDTWVNRHMQYTHGYGLVMNPVTQANRQGQPIFYLQDIPPVSTSPDLQVENPAIYYGETSSSYYIVNTDVPELNYPTGDENAYTHYSGQGGIQVSNLFRRALFAWELSDINILLSDYIHDESRLQVYRSVQERIRRIAPFLELDRDPYLVLHEGRLLWIQDAYTTSRHFPYSQVKRGVNYIRNSVKVVVDAYEGSVDFYQIDFDDPVIEVYASIFPDLFKSPDELPDGLDAHFRYPQDLFEIQLESYNRYHMTTPQVFYNQEDLWTRPNEKYAGTERLMDPYYVLARMPGGDQLEYMLISPTTPENRDNMIAWLAAKSDPGSYGKLVTYRLPKDRLIYGPAQIEARIDQDPEISQQIALWDQRGSSVIRGNLMVIPIEDSFLYVEPVFLLADGVDIPQLQRVIVSIGEGISMQPTIQEAILDLFNQQMDMPLALPAAPVPSEAPFEMDPTQQVHPDLEEARSLWEDLENTLRDREWIRYGELLEELDNLLGNP